MSAILVQTGVFRQKIQKVLLPTALALVISACGNNGFFQSAATEALKNEAYATSEFYLNKAEQSSRLEERQSYHLLAIRKLIDENKITEAQNTMSALSVGQFNPLQRQEYTLLSAQLAALQGDSQQASTLLKQMNLSQLSPSQLARVYEAKAKIAESSRDVIETVRARVALDNYLSDTQARQQNNDKIWALLRNANRGMLEHTAVNAGETGLAGWLSLIVSYNQNVSNPSSLPQVLDSWKAKYPSHSAVLLLPTELQNVANFQQTQLNSVALLLPLSGDAKGLGEIIRKGFNDAKGNNNAKIQVLDSDSAPIDSLLNQAAQQGVQTVVGPLLKPRVDEMLASSHINHLNVLALNSTANVRAVAKVCYYGLSPESEAQSAAERFVRDNVQNAIVFAPQGDFGQRASDAFAQQWRKLTNKEVDVRFYNQPQDSVVALQNSSVANGSAIYMLGTAEQVSDMKQGIDSSVLAGKVALYTSSRSNSPNNGPDFRLAMEGVKFSEIPLIAERDSSEYKLAAKLASNDFSMMRLYAMGSDAWLLANQFNEFRQIPGYKVSGLTGVLSAGANCNVSRELTWLQYSNGSIVSAY